MNSIKERLLRDEARLSPKATRMLNRAIAGEPLAIRPHHLSMFWEGKWPMNNRNVVQDSGSNPLYDHCERTAHKMAFNPKINESLKHDYWGPNNEGYKQFWSASYAFMLAIVELPPDQPVQVCRSKRDLVCSGCTKGKHCDQETLLPESLIVENSWIDEFSRKARAKKMPLTVTEEEVLGISGYKRIDTTLSVVKKVFGLK